MRRAGRPRLRPARKPGQRHRCAAGTLIHVRRDSAVSGMDIGPARSQQERPRVAELVASDACGIDAGRERSGCGIAGAAGNLDAAGRSCRKTAGGVSRLAGQAGTQAAGPAPAPGRDHGGRAGYRGRHPACRSGMPALLTGLCRTPRAGHPVQWPGPALSMPGCARTFGSACTGYLRRGRGGACACRPR
jgi:hypothetical protein